MDEKTLNKKGFFFISIIFFFYIIMLFIFVNVSNIMYNNAAIHLAVKESKNINFYISTLYSSDSFSQPGSFKRLDNQLNKFTYYPLVIYIKLYNVNGNIVYQYGRDVMLSDNQDAPAADKDLYRISTIKGTKDAVYETTMPVYENDKITGYIRVLFDLNSLEYLIFKEKRIIFMVIAVVNLFILIFLIIMFLNLQKRLFIAENEVNSLSRSDKLTNLLTKESFFEHMRTEIERVERSGGRLTLLTADVDNFLELNEKCGYDFGDMVLKTISGIFKENFRKYDYVGRFGGDEIIALLVDASETDGEIASEKCRKLLEQNKFFYEGQEIPVTISVGIASTDELMLGSHPAGNNPQNKNNMLFRNLLFNSLNALSRAKRNGKNRSIRNTLLRSE